MSTLESIALDQFATDGGPADALVAESRMRVPVRGISEEVSAQLRHADDGGMDPQVAAVQLGLSHASRSEQRVSAPAQPARRAQRQIRK